jgi:hypothetical protein
MRFVDIKGLACGSGPFQVPDAYGGTSGLLVNYYDFTGACTFHDKCYGTCKNKKEYCDVEFLFLMKDVCNGLSGYSYVDCLAAAHTYYLAVALFGDISYNLAQWKDCKCKAK